MLFLKRILLPICLLASLVPTAGHAVTPYAELSERQKKAFDYVQQFIRPLEKERIFFHYGKSAPCEALVAQGSYTGPIAAKYGNLSVKGGAVAGHGVYISGNYHSSANYFDGGGVIARLAEGAPVLDLTNGDIHRKLFAAGIRDKDIYELPLDATVRYSASSDWWVIKGASGVKFEPLNWQLIAADSALAENIKDLPSSMQLKVADLLFEEGRDLEPIVRAIEHEIKGGWGSQLVRSLRPEILESVLDVVVRRSTDRRNLARLWKNADRSDGAIEKFSRDQMRRLQQEGAAMSSGERANRFTFALQAPAVSDSEIVAFFEKLPADEQDELRKIARGLALRDHSYGMHEMAGRLVGRAARLQVDAPSLFSRMTKTEQKVGLKGMDPESLAMVLRGSRAAPRDGASLLLALRGADDGGKTLQGLVRYTDQDLAEVLTRSDLSSADRVDRILLAGLLKDTDESLLAKAWLRLDPTERAAAREGVASMLKLLEEPKGPFQYLYQEEQTIKSLGRLVGLTASDLPRKSAEAAELLSSFEKTAQRLSSFDPPKAYAPTRFGAVNHCKGYLRENLLALKYGVTALAVPAVIGITSAHLTKYAQSARHDSAIRIAQESCLGSGGEWRPNDDPSGVKLGQCTCAPAEHGVGLPVTAAATWDGNLIQLANCTAAGPSPNPAPQ